MTDEACYQAVIRSDRVGGNGEVFMNRRSNIFILTLITSFIVASRIPVFADETPDDRLRKALEENTRLGKSGNGVVVIDATFVNYNCIPLEIIIGRKVDGKWRQTALAAAGSTWGKIHYGGVHVVAPDEYFVLQVNCHGTMNGTMKVNGPHAKFQIAAGELVNVGSLKMTYTHTDLLGFTGKALRSVEGLTPIAIKYLKETYPSSVTKIINRPMTIVGPPEITTKRKIGF